MQVKLKVEQSILYSSKFFDQGRKEIGAWRVAKEAKVWLELACELGD